MSFEIPANVHLIDNPLVTDRLTVLRMKKTNTRKFREIVKEISGFLAYEIGRTLPMKDVEIQTPMRKTVQKRIDTSKKMAIVPILRAGVGMIPGFTKVYPDVQILNIGVKRDETTHAPISYYENFPGDIRAQKCIIIDPMLATGGSIEYTVEKLKEKGCKDIVIAAIITAPEGIARISSAYPDIPIFCCAIDDHLDKDKYIIPGLGDAGDRIFGTEAK
ncbi:MAG: uracil phosphoribosyltransferase [Eubacteriaceae bacterium]|uniref:Uracil phosphoribosyltransferase n=1 Tax=Candidatus Pseudoramibacter fermentans TaxID=2594427 RepID=A0A6L5GR53_9FIRM|nr:uracil phosphoribosyltransferase [Candidatus Pseudoramibacter fermentans]RRF92942.1 MAG: uracil phosphoribosyltransferase [Eubacteriaceae bacterium]